MKNLTFNWNYYQYVVINLTTGREYATYDTLDMAKKVCKDKNNELKYKYAVQQIHSVARFV